MNLLTLYTKYWLFIFNILCYNKLTFYFLKSKRTQASNCHSVKLKYNGNIS